MDFLSLASQMRRFSPSGPRRLSFSPIVEAEDSSEMLADSAHGSLGGPCSPLRGRSLVRSPVAEEMYPLGLGFSQKPLASLPEQPPQQQQLSPQQQQLPAFGWTVRGPPYLQQPLSSLQQSPSSPEEPPPVLTVALGEGWSSVRQRTITRPVSLDANCGPADAARPLTPITVPNTRPLTPITMTSTRPLTPITLASTRTPPSSSFIQDVSFSSSAATSSSNTFPTTHPVSSELTTQSEPPRRRVPSASSASVEPRSVVSDIGHPFGFPCSLKTPLASPRTPTTPATAACVAVAVPVASPTTSTTPRGGESAVAPPPSRGQGAPTRDSVSEAAVKRPDSRPKSRQGSRLGSRPQSRQDTTPPPSEHGTFTIGRGAPRVSFAGPGNPAGVVNRWPEIPHMPKAIARMLKHGAPGAPKAGAAVTAAAPRTMTKPIVVKESFPETQMVYLGSATGDRELPEWEARRRQEDAVKLVQRSLMDARVAEAWTRGVDMPLKQVERKKLFTYEPAMASVSALSELCANAVNRREVADALRDKPRTDPRAGIDQEEEEEHERELALIMPWDTPPSPDDIDEVEAPFVVDDSWKSSSTRRYEQGLSPRSVASLIRIERDKRMAKSPYYRAGHVYSSSMGRAESLIGLPPWMSPEAHATGLLLPPPPVVSPEEGSRDSTARTSARKKKRKRGPPITPSQYIGVTSQMSIGRVRSYLSNGTLRPVKECILHTRHGERPLPFAVRAPTPCICRADRRFSPRFMSGPPLLPFPTDPSAWRGRITPGSSEETISSRSYSSFRPNSGKSFKSTRTTGSFRRTATSAGMKDRRLASLSFTSY